MNKDNNPTPPRNKWATGKKLSMKRRSNFNDYTGRGIYMITIATESRRPLLGSLAGKANGEEEDNRPHVVLSPLGEKVKECWENIPRYHPQIELLKLCIMPDHIHGILFVHDRMNKHLGNVIWGFKSGTIKAARELGLLLDNGGLATVAEIPQPTKPTATTASFSSVVTSSPSSCASSASGSVGCGTSAAPLPHHPSTYNRAHGQLWEPGYNDRILSHEGQLQRMMAYLDDNPRRLLVKREHPEYFRQLGTITVAGTPMQAMGNRFLLDNPVKLQVQCSRSLTPQEIEQRKDFFLNEGTSGAILVSPCISPGEQQIATAALQTHIPLIVLLLKGLPPYFKPQPRYLEACSDGRLLILPPYPIQNQQLTDMRHRCLHLNDLADTICHYS